MAVILASRQYPQGWGATDGPSFPRRRAVHRDENDKAFTPLRYKRTRWHSVIGDSSIHRVG